MALADARSRKRRWAVPHARGRCSPLERAWDLRLVGLKPTTSDPSSVDYPPGRNSACVSSRARLSLRSRLRPATPNLETCPPREVPARCLPARPWDFFDQRRSSPVGRPRFGRIPPPAGTGSALLAASPRVPIPRGDQGRLSRRPMMRSFGSSSGALRTTSPRSASSSTASASTRSASGYLHWLAGTTGRDHESLGPDEVANTPLD